MFVNENECAAVGVNPKKIQELAKKISLAAKQLERMGCCVFGGSGSGEIRWSDCGGKGDIVLATLDGTFDGGDGATHLGEDGLVRGEKA